MTCAICSGSGPVNRLLSTVLPSAVTWWYAATSTYAPGRYRSGRSANRRIPRCVGTTPASVAAASLWATSVSDQSSGGDQPGNRSRKYFASRRSWRSASVLPNTGRSSIGLANRRTLNMRASRSAGISRRWLPMRCRNRPSLVWCTSNDGGTSTIRHRTGTRSAPGRYSQFNVGTIMGTQLTVAALITNCSRRSRRSGSIPTGVRSVSRIPITTVPPLVFAILTNTSASRGPARDSSRANATRLPRNTTSFSSSSVSSPA